MMNSSWNNTKSDNLHARLTETPDEWHEYHRLYREAREKWEFIPYEHFIEWAQSKIPGRIIGDFGCGDAIVSERLSELHEVQSFDHVAINEEVTVCNMSSVPVVDRTFTDILFCLSLMGPDVQSYLVEANSKLKVNGCIHIYEPIQRWKNVEELTLLLKNAKFDVTNEGIKELGGFYYVRAYQE